MVKTKNKPSSFESKFLEAGNMNIWNYQAQLTRRLGIWAGLNIAAGISLFVIFHKKRRGDPLLHAAGIQAAGWGMVNALIALAGGRSARKRQAALPDPQDALIVTGEAARLSRLLWINCLLDVGYMLGGLALARTRGRRDSRAAGHGWGILVQGAFLFVFDLVHAWMLGGER
jgi:hypothetical protein